MPALFSSDSKYRYWLQRELDDHNPRTLGWVMLNPSVAGATADDPTIRKCIGFTKRLGFGRLEVCNLFALVSTDPKAILTVDDPVGPENDQHLVGMFERCEFVICAWGANKTVSKRAEWVKWLLRGKDVRVLSLTKGGHPGHPLFLSYTCVPTRFGVPQGSARDLTNP